MKTPQVTPPWSTGIYIGNGVVATPSPQFKKGDRVKIYVAKSNDPEMRVLADKIGDELDGVVLFQTGNIVACDTEHGQINPFIRDIVAKPKPKKIRLECADCGDNLISMDASPYWDVDTQQWEIGEIRTDEIYCTQCGSHDIDEIEIE